MANKIQLCERVHSWNRPHVGCGYLGRRAVRRAGRKVDRVNYVSWRDIWKLARVTLVLCFHPRDGAWLVRPPVYGAGTLASGIKVYRNAHQQVQIRDLTDTLSVPAQQSVLNGYFDTANVIVYINQMGFRILTSCKHSWCRIKRKRKRRLQETTHSNYNA